MTDISLALSADGTSLDWCDPAILAQPIDSSGDVETYVLMLLGTDRVVPLEQYRLQTVQRRGSWHDTQVGEFGCLFWLGTEMNQWSRGPKLPQIQRWAEQALETVYTEGLIQQPAQVSVYWLTNESVQLDINLITTNGQQRAIPYVLPA